MAENRKKKNQQKLLWWLTPVLLLAVLAIWFGGEALGRGFQWLSDSQTSESTTTAQKVPSDEMLTVRFLDVGQGDSILLSCGEDTMLIDGGPVEEGQFLVSRLNRLDVTELTYVVNTHPDEDHCGGLAAVLAKYPAEHVYSSVTEYTTKVFSNVVKYTEEQGRQIEVPQTGTHWSLGSAAVTVIGPVQEYSDPNNGSLVLRVDYGGTSFLFTGDMEQKAEGDLLESGADVHADVLKAGHHGSPTSSSEAFLTAVQPSVAVISVGADNEIIIVSDGETLSITTDPTSREPAAGKDAPFVGNRNSMIVHSASCAKLPGEENRIYFNSAEEAEEYGYKKHTCIK